MVPKGRARRSAEVRPDSLGPVERSADGLPSIGDLQPGESRVVTVDGAEIALFNVEGKLYAVSNRCPHRNAPLSRGHLEGTAIRCPLHGYLFDLATGSCLNQPDLRVQTYAVSCRNGDLTIE